MKPKDLRLAAAAATGILVGAAIVFALMSWRESASVTLRFRTVGLIILAVLLFIFLLALILLRRAEREEEVPGRKSDASGREISLAIRDAVELNRQDIHGLSLQVRELASRIAAAGSATHEAPPERQVEKGVPIPVPPQASHEKTNPPRAARETFAGAAEILDQWWQDNGREINSILRENRMGVQIVDSLEQDFREKGIRFARIRPIQDANAFKVELDDEAFRDHFILFPILHFPLRKHREFFHGEVNDPKRIERPALARIIRTGGNEFVDMVEGGKGVLQ